MSTPNADQDLIKSKWLSLENHIHDKHTHDGLWKKCGHATTHGQKKKKWFTPRKCSFNLHTLAIVT